MSGRSWMLPVALVAGGMYTGKAIAKDNGTDQNSGALVGAGVAIATSLLLHGAGSAIRALAKPTESAANLAARDGAVLARDTTPLTAEQMLAGKIKPSDLMYPHAYGIARQAELLRTGRLS